MLTDRRVVVPALAALALASAGCGGGGESTASERAGGDVVLRGGGVDAFETHLRRVRGLPVVVNQWASWCRPCKAEFPFFQRLSERLKGRVSFVGVNSMDSAGDAREFLLRYPTSFPHFAGQDAKIARSFRGGRAWPTTAYYGADGELNVTHQGSYRTEADLERDIRRYAIDG